MMKKLIKLAALGLLLRSGSRSARRMRHGYGYQDGYYNDGYRHDPYGMGYHTSLGYLPYKVRKKMKRKMQKRMLKRALKRIF